MSTSSLVPVAFGLVFVTAFVLVAFKGVKLHTQADPVRRMRALADPPVCTFGHVSVELNPGQRNRSLLKTAMVGNNLVVRARSFQTDPAFLQPDT